MDLLESSEVQNLTEIDPITRNNISGLYNELFGKIAKLSTVILQQDVLEMKTAFRSTLSLSTQFTNEEVEIFLCIYFDNLHDLLPTNIKTRMTHLALRDSAHDYSEIVTLHDQQIRVLKDRINLYHDALREYDNLEFGLFEDIYNIILLRPFPKGSLGFKLFGLRNFKMLEGLLNQHPELLKPMTEFGITEDDIRNLQSKALFQDPEYYKRGKIRLFPSPYKTSIIDLITNKYQWYADGETPYFRKPFIKFLQSVYSNINIDKLSE